MRPLLACALCAVTPSVASAQNIIGSYAFTTLAGRPGFTGGADGTGLNAQFSRPWGMAVDAAGNIFVADSANYTVRQITSGGIVTTVAGTQSTTGNRDGVGSAAQFGAIIGTPPSVGPVVAGPFGIAVGPDGHLFVADSYSHTLRRVTPAGVVSTFSGVAGTIGSFDGSLAAARYAIPWGIAVDAAGTIYVADTFNHVIRRITTNGVVTTIAGSTGDWGSADGIGSASRFLYPTAIAIDPAGRLYVTDSNNTIRRISPPAPGQIAWETTTIAGEAGTYGTSDGTGAAARFGSAPTISSQNPSNVTVRTAAGSTGLAPAFFGRSYVIGELPGIAVDSAGNAFVTDFGNNTIRKISPAGVVTTIGGTNSTGSSDGIGTDARFSRPTGIAVDARGNLYISDSQAQTIRKGVPITLPAIQVPPANQIAGTGSTVVLTVEANASPTPRFQWSRNGINVPGATSSTLTITNVQPAHAGSYTVSVTNVAGTATSSPATLSVVSFPVISVHPVAQTVALGQSVTLTVAVGGSPTPSLQWFRDGTSIPGATDASLVLANVQPAAAGAYTVVATNASGSATSEPARVLINSGRIVNLSIRTSLAASDSLIVGFVSTGGPKSLLVRAIGPTLREFGVTEAMADPLLRMHAAGVLTATNDNWGSGAAVAQLTLAARQVGAFALPADSLDAAVLATSVDAAMTVETNSRNQAGGIVLIELYDADPLAASRLVNVSARAKVGAGENALFAGFAVTGNAPKTLLIRAVGPTLGAFGVEGVLTDPRLDVYPAGSTAPLASNDNWGGNAALVAAFRSVSAFGLPAIESRDAALLVVLQPGSFTAQISGVGGRTGEVLLEIYELP